MFDFLERAIKGIEVFYDEDGKTKSFFIKNHGDLVNLLNQYQMKGDIFYKKIKKEKPIKVERKQIEEK